MIPEDADRTLQLVNQIRDALAELTRIHDRSFALDGHAVGSLGEVVAREIFGLTLEVPSNAGFDARTEDGYPVEIKATFGTRVAFRDTSHSVPDLRLLVLNLSASDSADLVVFNGPYAVVKDALPQKLASNGQRSISLSRLREIQKQVPDEDLLPVKRHFGWPG